MKVWFVGDGFSHWWKHFIGRWPWRKTDTDERHQTSWLSSVGGAGVIIAVHVPGWRMADDGARGQNMYVSQRTFSWSHAVKDWGVSAVRNIVQRTALCQHCSENGNWNHSPRILTRRSLRPLPFTMRRHFAGFLIWMGMIITHTTHTGVTSTQRFAYQRSIVSSSLCFHEVREAIAKCQKHTEHTGRKETRNKCAKFYHWCNASVVRAWCLQ